MSTLSTRSRMVSLGRGTAGQHRAVDEVAGQNVPEVLGDGRGLDLAAVDGPGEDVRHESFPLVEKLLLHHGVELGAPRRLHEHRTNGARMGADVSADLLSQSQQIARAASRCQGRPRPAGCPRRMRPTRVRPSSATVDRAWPCLRAPSWPPRRGSAGRSRVPGAAPASPRAAHTPAATTETPRHHRNSGSRGPPWNQWTCAKQ